MKLFLQRNEDYNQYQIPKNKFQIPSSIFDRIKNLKSKIGTQIDMGIMEIKFRKGIM